MSVPPQDQQYLHLLLNKNPSQITIMEINIIVNSSKPQTLQQITDIISYK